MLRNKQGKQFIIVEGSVSWTENWTQLYLIVWISNLSLNIRNEDIQHIFYSYI